LNYHFSRGI